MSSGPAVAGSVQAAAARPAAMASATVRAGTGSAAVCAVAAPHHSTECTSELCRIRMARSSGWSTPIGR